MELLNTKIGKYTLTKYIGEGGMASVYEGTHLFLGTKAAVKVLNPMLSKNDQFRQRFRNEAAFMASLDHPNITKVLDFEDSDEGLAIVMELLEGSDLSDLVKEKGALTFEEFKPLFIQILDAFKYAHNQGIVHRDIKPSNIFIDSRGTVKILDFGIAKLFGQGNEMTQTGTQMGTPAYMSPEQVKGDKSIDHRSDIYALGVTLFYAMEGRSPYDTDNESQFDIFNKIVFEELPVLTENSAQTFLIQKACQKDRNLRFQQIEEFENALNGLETSETKIDFNKSTKADEKKQNEKKDIAQKSKIDQSNIDVNSQQKGFFNLNRLLIGLIVLTFGLNFLFNTSFISHSIWTHYSITYILPTVIILLASFQFFFNNKVVLIITIGIFALYWLIFSFNNYIGYGNGYVAPLMISIAAILSIFKRNTIAFVLYIFSFLLLNLFIDELFFQYSDQLNIDGILGNIIYFLVFLCSIAIYFFSRKNFVYFILISITLLNLVFMYQRFFGYLFYPAFISLENNLLLFLVLPFIELSSELISNGEKDKLKIFIDKKKRKLSLFVFFNFILFGSGLFLYDRTNKRSLLYIFFAIYSWGSYIDIFFLHLVPLEIIFHNNSIIIVLSLSILLGWFISYVIGTIDLIVTHKKQLN